MSEHQEAPWRSNTIGSDTEASQLPSVSVVVPTHNRPELVLRAVRGALKQTYRGHIEVVVVFDNADPHPIDVDIPTDRELRLLVNDARKPGLAGARNTGILASHGGYVAFCDDDDAWRTTKLEKQFALLGRFDAEAVVSTGITALSETGRTVRLPPPGPLGLKDFLRDRIMEIHPSTLLFTRGTFDRVGLVDEELPASYAEDYDLLLRVSRILPVISVQEPLVDVRFHSGSFYASQWQVIRSGLEYLLGKHPEFDQVPAGRARIDGQLAFATAALGERRRALALSREALRRNPLERRAYAALLVAAGLPASSITRLARRFGRGI